MEKAYVLTEHDVDDLELAIEETRLEFNSSLKELKEYVLSKIKNKGLEKQGR